MARGFTLIELVMVIAITGTVAVGVSSFLGSVVGGYVDAASRGRMAGVLVIASEKISRDLRGALPNSIRVGGAGGNSCIEWLPIRRGGYYLSVPLATAANSFVAVSPGNSVALTGRVVVYPVDTAALYSLGDSAPADVTSAIATLPAGTDEITVTLGAPHQFRLDSPGKRFFLIGEPVAYCFDSGANRIYRHTDYGFNPVPMLPPAGGRRDLLVTEVASLAFEFADSSRWRNAVVRISLAAAVGDESITLDQEAQVRNVP
ncbi:MAG: type II secretion system protein J [Pseudomonadota bacterium]